MHAGRLRARSALQAVRRALGRVVRELRKPREHNGRRLRRRLRRRRSAQQQDQPSQEHGLERSFPQRGPSSGGRSGGKRKKAPFWQDGRLKTDAATTTDSESHRLCLSAWRGQLAAGASAVFSPCTRAEDSGPRAAKEAMAQRFSLIHASKSGASPSPTLVGSKLQLGGGEGGGLCLSAPTEGVSWDV